MSFGGSCSGTVVDGLCVDQSLGFEFAPTFGRTVSPKHVKWVMMGNSLGPWDRSPGSFEG